jgi:hypothetical protein
LQANIDKSTLDETRRSRKADALLKLFFRSSRAMIRDHFIKFEHKGVKLSIGYDHWTPERWER